MAEPVTTAPPVPSRDAQAAAPATRVSLSRVGVTGVEKAIQVGDGRYQASLECFVDLNAEQAGVHMSRFEEVVNEAIDGVVLEESLRAEVLAAHIAERVRERQAGKRAEVRISARYPETVPAPVSGHPHPGDLHAVRHRRRLRARHPHPARRRGPGHDRLPVRPGPRRGRRPRAARRAGLQPRRDRPRHRHRPPRDPQPARHRHPLDRLPRERERRHRRARAAADRRVLDVLRDLRADEARRRAPRRREGARQPPLRRGLRPRDDPAGRTSASTASPRTPS